MWAGNNYVNPVKSAPLVHRSEEINALYHILGVAARFASLKDSVRNSTEVVGQKLPFSDVEQVVQIFRAQTANYLSGEMSDEICVKPLGRKER